MKYFDRFTSQVARLKPGERIAADKERLADGWGHTLGSFLGDGFTPMDRVLERIIGSAFTHRYFFTEFTRVLIFKRLHTELPEGVRSYVSPDHRGWFKLREDRLHQHRGISLSQNDEVRIRCALHGHRWIPAKVLPYLEPMPVVPDCFDAEVEALIYLVDGRICDNCRAQERTG